MSVLELFAPGITVVKDPPEMVKLRVTKLSDVTLEGVKLGIEKLPEMLTLAALKFTPLLPILMTAVGLAVPNVGNYATFDDVYRMMAVPSVTSIALPVARNCYA
jgi:hypothetical protein